MNINVSNQSSTTLIEVSGRIDSNNAHELGEALNGAISAGNTKLILDLSTLDYMSSAGLREIVSAYKKVQGSGDLRLVQPSQRVSEVLEMAGLDSIFKIFPSQSAAVASF